MSVRGRAAAPIALGAVIGLLVCFPFIGRGRLLLLDYAVGPHQDVVPRAFWGLDGGIVAGLPSNVALASLAHVIGAAATWLPILLFFPVAGAAIARLANGGLAARTAACLVYCVNPFVFERIAAGQIGVLLGYALLPFAVSSLIRAPELDWRTWMRPVLWITVLIACSIHFAWISCVVVLVSLAQQRVRPRAVRWAALTALGVAATTLYVVVPRALAHSSVQVGGADLSAYRTSRDATFGLYANVVGLYGFWRRSEVALPKSVVRGWPFLLIALLVVVAIGARDALQRPARRQAAILLIASGIVGYVLALGDQGPTGSLFRWAYFHVPGFDVMREPQKFLCLLALAYAVLFGWGAEILLERARGRSRIALLGAVLAVPLVYTPTMFGGLDGHLRSSRIPSAWARADALMGAGDEAVLFLPWHLYLSFPFTGHRVVANPADGFFRRPVISGDNVELTHLRTQSTSPRSSFLEDAFSRGDRLRSFGSDIAPLGVQYVVLAKTVDWYAYDWLSKQGDLSLVLDDVALQVWRNDARVTVGERTLTPSSPPDRDAILVATPIGPGRRAAEALRRSPVGYQVPPGTPGFVQLAEPFDPGWELDGRRAVALPRGNLGWTIGRDSARAAFTPWRCVRVAYALSLSALAIVILITLRRRRGQGVLTSVTDGA